MMIQKQKKLVIIVFLLSYLIVGPKSSVVNASLGESLQALQEKLKALVGFLGGKGVVQGQQQVEQLTDPGQVINSINSEDPIINPKVTLNLSNDSGIIDDSVGKFKDKLKQADKVTDLSIGFNRLSEKNMNLIRIEKMT